MGDDRVLRNIDDQMAIAGAWAQYWTAMALTGATISRNITHLGGKPFTKEEKTRDALMIAKNHIQRMQELSDKRMSTMAALEEGGEQ